MTEVKGKRHRALRRKLMEDYCEKEDLMESEDEGVSCLLQLKDEIKGISDSEDTVKVCLTNPNQSAPRVSCQAPLEGRRYHITKEQLEFLIDCHMTIRQMADVLNVSHSVVKLRMRCNIVIHGAVDGYSRLVVFLKASDNNRTATVMESFEAAITSYGVPSQTQLCLPLHILEERGLPLVAGTVRALLELALPKYTTSPATTTNPLAM
ncbi:uncharacterized protein LOC120042812 isoform X2 [Salvelinus namaycush]|uniref:Uncharacterized protein LOC120042812 isoform X2 n=1 Tax=Salvelinus namaycush TaxID=8040 RepID=A0A8U0QHS3_SALNM|nr:uncharacterized protein LOC120042812 isoform X2 [Salvelinus namaycush]